MVRINNREYAYGDIDVYVFGKKVVGLRGINYEPAKGKHALISSGYGPRSIQHGPRGYSGTFSILQSELDALNRTARARGYKDILDVDFDIVLVYGDEASALTTDKIYCASVEKFNRGMKVDDFYCEHTLQFIALDVDCGV